MIKNIFACITLLIICAFTATAFADSTTIVPTGTAVIASPGSQGQDQGQVLVNNPEDHSVSIAAPIPGSVGFGPVINYFGKPLPSEGFQPIETIIMYSCWYSDGSLESILKGVEDAEAEMKIADLTYSPAPVRRENGDTKYIKIIISRDKYNSDDMAFIGFVTARSDHRKTTMVEVMAKAALEAMEVGANVIHFTAQGAVRDVFSSGWGIGFHTTQAQTYGDKSNVTSGGTGYSNAKAGVRDLAWLQGFALIDYTLIPPLNKPMTR